MADSTGFFTLPQIPGVMGLDLKKPVDLIDPLHLPRMTNCVRNEIGELTGRPGQTSLITGVSGEIRFLQELNIPSTVGLPYTNSFVIGTREGSIYGSSGTSSSEATAALIASGFGSVTTGVVYRPPNSGVPWTYLASSAKMGKVQAGATTLSPIGLPAPSGRDNRFRINEFDTPSGSLGAIDRIRFSTFGFQTVTVTGGGQEGSFTTYGTLNKTVIDSCDSTTGWVANAGTGGAPTIAADSTDKKEGTASLKLTTNKGGATGTYYNFVSKPNALDMSFFTGGTVAADDEDIVHLWIKTDRPDKLTELRVFFVVDSSFDTATLPGNSTTLNVNSYEKSFRPSDFTSAYLILGSTLNSGATANTNRATDQQLQKSTDTRGSTKLVREQTDLSRSIASQLGPGVGWTEYGIIGLPLKRGEFRRIGNDATRGWGTVSGVVIAVQVVDNTTGVNVWLDDVYMTGGAGLDTSLPGNTPYDYRVTNYSPSTGVESNPSPVQGAGYQLDSLRRAIIVHPAAYGDPSIRQRIYRRGGTLQNNWFFVGTNNTDGGTYTDILSDAAIVAGNTLSTDNDQPVTTVDKGGNVVYAAPVAAIFGPYNDLVFACGDAYRKGHLYWCKPTNADAWPAVYIAEVCSPSEELMQGCVYQGQCFVFSRERLFNVIPNLSNVLIVVTTPTQCGHGLVSRRGVCVGAGAIWFVSKDGIYSTTGGPERSITEDSLWDLFHNKQRNGYFPVDWSQADTIQLELHGNELWFIYQDTTGAISCLVYDTVFKYWRANSFGQSVTAIHSIKGGTDFSAPLMLAMGGRSSGTIYLNTGTSDDGLAINGAFRTGANDAGQPRNEKLWGDVMADVDRAGNAISVTPYFNAESSTGATATLNTGSGRQRYYVDTGAVSAFNISLDFSWSTTSTPPVFYKVGPSAAPQADTSELRVTDWDSVGTYADKQVKGIIFDCDTGGVTKTINVLGDGVFKTSFTVTASGRQVVEVSFAQISARLLRLQPADTVQWKVFDKQWIFDPEPLAITRWESQEITHGIPGAQTPLFMNVTIKSTSTVTLQVTWYRENGAVTVDTYQIASTAGLKTKKFVGFNATRGVLYKYLFTGEQPFSLYRPETEMQVQPWGAQSAVPVRPFGDDDQDLVRSSVNAQFAAQRSGGAGWTQPNLRNPAMSQEEEGQ